MQNRVLWNYFCRPRNRILLCGHTPIANTLTKFECPLYRRRTQSTASLEPAFSIASHSFPALDQKYILKARHTIINKVQIGLCRTITMSHIRKHCYSFNSLCLYESKPAGSLEPQNSQVDTSVGP